MKDICCQKIILMKIELLLNVLHYITANVLGLYMEVRQESKKEIFRLQIK